MKRILQLLLSLIFCMALAFSCFSAEESGAQFSYLASDSGIYITGILSETKKAEIPSHIDGGTVVGISENAFSGNTALESVYLPETVAVIGKNAFRGCYSLTDISLSRGLISIEDFAFYECTALQSITIPAGVSRIGANAFDYSAKLVSINVEKENAHFADNDGVLFNKSGTELIKYPPSRQTNSYTIPEGVDVIYPHAFNYAYLLEEISLPSSLRIIGEYAFAACSSLRELYLPEKVAHVGNSAFAGCTGLTKLTVSSGPAGLDDDKYDDISPQIFAPNDSTAKVFAEENGFAFYPLEETPTENKLRFSTKVLSPAWRYFPYSQQIEVSSEGAKISLKDSSSLPPGLVLKNGILTGRPEVWGIYRFTLIAKDGEETAEQSYTLAINTDDFEEINSYNIIREFPEKITMADNLSEIYMTVDCGEKSPAYVSIDGQRLSRGEYEAENGSIVISGGYLKSLVLGNHILVAEYEGGDAVAAVFQLKKSPAVLPLEEEPSAVSEPSTYSVTLNTNASQPSPPERVKPEDSGNPNTTQKEKPLPYFVFILSGITAVISLVRTRKS